VSEVFRIESLGQKAVWDNDHNKGDYPAQFAGDDREVMIFHDAASNFSPPAVGDELFGRIEKDKRGNWRFKRAKRTEGGQGSPPGQRAQGEGPGLTWQNKPYNSSAEHPRNEARMIHTACLSSAPVYIEQMLTASVVGQPKNPDEYWALVSQVVGRLSRTYAAAFAGAAAPSAHPSSPSSNGGEVPADMSGLGQPPSQASMADESVPF
jgi:hypothetical protein